MNNKIISLLLLLSANVFSQVGPQLPNCPDCNDIESLSPPTSTLWWNPDQSGVGMNISVQNNQVYGIYYGYTQYGDSVWYTFFGNLVESEEPGVSWELSAALDLFENGKCINCDYQFPNQVNFNHDITIRFNQANHASYKIDNGELQNMIPHLFSHESTPYFSEQTGIKIPNLRGYWSFSVILPSAIFPGNHAIESSVYYIYSSQTIDVENGTKILNIEGASLLDFHDLLTCYSELDENDVITGPQCILFPEWNADGSININEGYQINIADIGTNKMVGIKSNGDRIEGYKLDYNPF